QSGIWRSEAWIFDVLLRAARCLSVDRASALGGELTARVGPRLAKHRHVLTNYRRAFPEWNEERVERTARGMWRNLGRVLGEMAFLEQFCDALRDRIEIVDGGWLEPLRRGRAAILVGAHLGNWELTQTTPRRLGFSLTALYSPLANRYLESVIAGLRARLPCRFLAVEGASRQLLRELRAGRCVGLLMDQREDDGEPVPFFGIPASTTTGPARLALKTGVPLIPVRVERLEGVHFRMTIHPPVEPDPACVDLREAAFDMTAKVNGLFEEWIRARPEQWLCVKRRWRKPHRRPPRRSVPPTAEVAA
ncbi:MAG TPA: lauroyl acyltransferase, partial [Rhodospirillales bacterium]|nr:lauroyl acyltransferase [Rhodospirillales bacterium]